MNEIFIFSLGVGIFLALVIVVHEVLDRHMKENQTFARNHAEDAMKIKAKQFDNGYHRAFDYF